MEEFRAKNAKILGLANINNLGIKYIQLLLYSKKIFLYYSIVLDFLRRLDLFLKISSRSCKNKRQYILRGNFRIDMRC